MTYSPTPGATPTPSDAPELSLEELFELFRPTEADIARVLAKVAGRESPEEVEARTGIPAEHVVELRKMARERRAGTQPTGESAEVREMVEKLKNNPGLAEQLVAASRTWMPRS